MLTVELVDSKCGGQQGLSNMSVQVTICCLTLTIQATWCCSIELTGQSQWSIGFVK